MVSSGPGLEIHANSIQGICHGAAPQLLTIALVPCLFSCVLKGKSSFSISTFAFF
jgi:hypothetical protein